MPKRKNTLASFLNNCREAIANSGFKGLSLRSLLGAFGYKKRGAKNLNEIKDYLRDHGFFLTTSIEKYEELYDISLENRVYIYPYPAGPKGKLFESEADLQTYFVAKEIYKELGLTEIREEYSPKGFANRLDILSKDARGCWVVVELKNADGNRSAVEQVLGYIGAVKAENPHREVRGILITGTVDPGTLHAIYGLDREHLITWYQYCKTNKGEIKFVEITNELINNYVKLYKRE